jgi:hypothetical protein
MIVITSKEKLLKSLIPTKHVVSCRVIANKRKFGMVERACLLIRSGGVDGHNTPPSPLEGDFLFSHLFLGLLSLRGDALFGGPFSSWQVVSSLTSPTSDAGCNLQRGSRNKLISHLLYHFIINPSTTASSNPLQRGSRGWGTLIHQNHAAGEENGSIMVGMFVSLCLASKKSSEREFFVPAGMLIGAELF